MNKVVLTNETAKIARVNANKAKNPQDIPLCSFTLPDGQKLNYGCNNGVIKHRIGPDGVWDFCRSNIKKKLVKAIKENNVARVKFLIKCLNIVQDDHHFCNFINGFNDSMVSKKISYQEFVEKYQARILTTKENE